MPAHLILSALILFCTFATAGADELIAHSFFVAGPSFTGIIDEDGNESWNSGPHRVHHFQILTTNGKPLEGTPLK